MCSERPIHGLGGLEKALKGVVWPGCHWGGEGAGRAPVAGLRVSGQEWGSCSHTLHPWQQPRNMCP